MREQQKEIHGLRLVPMGASENYPSSYRQGLDLTLADRSSQVFDTPPSSVPQTRADIGALLLGFLALSCSCWTEYMIHLMPEFGDESLSFGFTTDNPKFMFNHLCRTIDPNLMLNEGNSNTRRLTQLGHSLVCPDYCNN